MFKWSFPALLSPTEYHASKNNLLRYAGSLVTFLALLKSNFCCNTKQDTNSKDRCCNRIWYLQPITNGKGQRVMITNILKRAKPPQIKNITSNQQKALGDLRNDESITIVPADKGRATVVEKEVHVSVYRKPPQTDRYLDYNSHHPIQHKRSVANTLFDRATKIPSTNWSWRSEHD